MAPRLPCHSSCRATIVVTASGGGWNDDAPPVEAWIRRNFTKPMIEINAAIATSMTTIRLNISTSLRERHPSVGSGPALPEKRAGAVAHPACLWRPILDSRTGPGEARELLGARAARRRGRFAERDPFPA